MNNYQMFRKIQERDNIIKKYSNDTKEDLIDLVIEKDNIIDNLQSKIDKAIEIDKIARKYFNKQIPRNIREQGFLNEIYNYLCDIEDILKEDK